MSVKQCSIAFDKVNRRALSVVSSVASSRLSGASSMLHATGGKTGVWLSAYNTDYEISAMFNYAKGSLEGADFGFPGPNLMRIVSLYDGEYDFDLYENKLGIKHGKAIYSLPISNMDISPYRHITVGGDIIAPITNKRLWSDVNKMFSKDSVTPIFDFCKLTSDGKRSKIWVSDNRSFMQKVLPAFAREEELLIHKRVIDIMASVEDGTLWRSQKGYVYGGGTQFVKFVGGALSYPDFGVLVTKLKDIKTWFHASSDVFAEAVAQMLVAANDNQYQSTLLEIKDNNIIMSMSSANGDGMVSFESMGVHGDVTQNVSLNLKFLQRCMQNFSEDIVIGWGPDSPVFITDSSLEKCMDSNFCIVMPLKQGTN